MARNLLPLTLCRIFIRRILFRLSGRWWSILLGRHSRTEIDCSWHVLRLWVVHGDWHSRYGGDQQLHRRKFRSWHGCAQQSRLCDRAVAHSAIDLLDRYRGSSI